MDDQFTHIKEAPKPKFGCFFIAAPLAAALITLWVVFV